MALSLYINLIKPLPNRKGKEKEIVLECLV